MSGLGRMAVGLMAAAALLAANVQQAQASIGSCLSAYTGADFFQLVGTFADPELSQCAAEIQVGPDIIMAAATAGMVALAFDNAFTDTAQCKALVQTTIGGFIAKLLLAATPVADFLKSNFPGAFSALVDMASGQAVGALGAVPGLGFILHKVDCGCQFAGAGLASKKALEDYYASVKGCGQFFADVGDALLGVFQSGPESAAEFFNGSNYGLTPGVQEEQVSFAVACAPGLNATCDVCWGGAKMEKVGDKLACKCPATNQGYTTSNDSGCQVCPAGTLQMPNGQCGGCPKGQAYQGGACVAACPTGQILGSNGQCGGCPAGAHASYAEFKFVQEGNYSVVAPVNSLGACVVCPSGSVFSESQNKCVAGCPAWQKDVGGQCVNRCGPNEKFTPGKTGGIVVNGGTVIPGQNTPSTCTPCPGGTQLNSFTNFCVKGGAAAPPKPATPECPAWQSWDGNACTNRCGANLVYSPATYDKFNKFTPQTCKPCAPGSQFTNKTNSCNSCPSGAAWIPFGGDNGGSCKCPAGSAQQGNLCVSTAPLGQPNGGDVKPPVLIPGPGGFPQRGVTSCPPGTVRSPQGACMPFRMSPAQPNGGGTSPPVVAPGGGFQPQPGSCPPGTTRNAQGACIAFRPVQPSGRAAPPVQRLPPGAVLRSVDCSTRGANDIKSPAPGGCAACPDGLVANAARDNCVAPPMFNDTPLRVAPPPVRRGP
ncbi:hypothetical protein [Phenylobacterium sp.]|uniref:hypothetical protein n=1 Tax=Phenylobacterium sp. TaxID=1871053 RepID=UPI0030F38881